LFSKITNIKTFFLARSDGPSDDRSSSGFNRDRQNRGDHGRCMLFCILFERKNIEFIFTASMGSGSRDNQQGNDYGFGYPRTRDDRGGGNSGGNRDYNRSGQRNRYQDDDNRSSSGLDRPRYAGRYSDTR